MKKHMAPIKADGLTDVGSAVRYDVYIQWKDGKGGAHRKDSLGEAIEEAEALARRGYGKPGKEIRIVQVATKAWRYDP